MDELLKEVHTRGFHPVDFKVNFAKLTACTSAMRRLASAAMRPCNATMRRRHRRPLATTAASDARDAALFQTLVSEAREASECDDTTFSSGMDALLACENLFEAVAEVVSAKLARDVSDTRLPRAALRAMFLETLQGDERVGADVEAILERDPSATTHLQCVAYFKGFHAIQAQRCAHVFWKRGGFENDHLAFALQDRVNELFAVDAHPGAIIGGGCFMDHATNVVIGETAEIGRDCTILHGVTLGGTGKARTKRHPTIGDRVTIGAGATVIGPILVGDDATVAAQAVVSVDVPGGITVVETNRFLDPNEHHALKAKDPETWAYDPMLHAQGDRPKRSNCKWPFDEDDKPSRPPSLPEGF